MDSKKYIGMDVHKESISIAVRNDAGKIVMECVIETKAAFACPINTSWANRNAARSSDLRCRLGARVGRTPPRRQVQGEARPPAESKDRVHCLPPSAKGFCSA